MTIKRCKTCAFYLRESAGGIAFGCLHKDLQQFVIDGNKGINRWANRPSFMPSEDFYCNRWQKSKNYELRLKK